MSAVVGLLNESLTEAIKSFYKLRKSYLTLEGVMDAEKKFLQTRSTSSLASTASATSSKPASGTSVGGSAVAKVPAPEDASAATSKISLTKVNADEGPVNKSSAVEAKKASQDDDDDDEFDFVDADEEVQGAETPLEYLGHLNVAVEKGESVELDNTKRDVHTKASSASHLPSEDSNQDAAVPNAIEDFEHMALTDTLRPEEDISLYSDHPVDVFIISGANFCFGILLLIISLVPPAFATLLKIVGFKGDRDRGTKMLWQATKFHNIHGAMGGLVLFGYYNGLNALCDIIPSSGEGSYPTTRLKALLVEMRKRHPKSHLWLLEEARMLGSEKELEKAVEFIANTGESSLKQLEALSWFERSLNTMYMHDYEGTSFAFLKCITLNNWSHGLYYFICGASHVELYRRTKLANPKLASSYAEKAVDLFNKVAPNTGKKKFMGRQLPFDVFVNRKIAKWEGRAKEWNCDFIDAIGVSPIEEMNYFWNGYKRMRNDHLDVSLQNLAWSEGPENPHWEKEGLDEHSILAILRAATLRNRGDTVQAKEILQTQIINQDKALFKGPNKDAWTAPCARYEMAANLWREADGEGRPGEHLDLLEQCKGWLVEVAGWESYDLDARYVSL